MSESVQVRNTAGRTAYVHRVERMSAHYEHTGAGPASTRDRAAPTNMGLDQ
ncbi:hypothetical protein ACR6C2_09125 [Streptomyces sp. INA 01156]